VQAVDAVGGAYVRQSQSATGRRFTRIFAGGSRDRPAHDEQVVRLLLQGRLAWGGTSPPDAFTPSAHTTAGLRFSVSSRTCEKPASRSAVAIFRPRVVAASSVAPGPARLKGDRDSTVAPEHPPQLSERLDRPVPELQRVDRQDLVERRLECRQALDAAKLELDLPAPHGLGVALPGLTHHHLGVVEPAHIAARGDAGQLADRDSGPAPDLEHAVVALHIEQRYRPGICAGGSRSGRP
jgi:hypothetical protein